MELERYIDGVQVKPCVGCGYCCVKTPCWVAQRIYGNSLKHCPELKWVEDEQRHVCRLMTLHEPLGSDYKLFAGEGCCASLLNSWRTDIRNRTTRKKK